MLRPRIRADFCCAPGTRLLLGKETVARVAGLSSAELQGPRKLSRIRPEIFDFDPNLGPKAGPNQSPKYPARYPQTGTQRFRTIRGRFRLVSTTIRNVFNCEIVQPSSLAGPLLRSYPRAREDIRQRNPEVVFGQVVVWRPGVPRNKNNTFLRKRWLLALPPEAARPINRSFPENVWCVGLGAPSLPKTTWP
jgi:hypothetical protein